MNRLLQRLALSGLVAVAAVTGAAPARAQVADDFQSYSLGSLPSPLWHDAGAVLPGNRVPPFPSAYVFNTLDKFGHPTQAVTTVGNLADSKGIYAFVPVSNHYSLFADVRVDRYSDAPTTTAEDWAMQLTFGQNGVDNWASTPQAGIYASSLTGGWRIYAATASAFADVDLGVAAVVGTWYTVAQSLDVTTGQFHSQIWDGATGTSLVDRFDLIPGWNPADAQFDAFAFFGGDLAVNDTQGNIGVIDNVNVTAVTTPEPGTMALAVSGLLPLAAFARRRRQRAA